MNFFIWKSAYEEGLCAVGALENVPKDWEINEGISRQGGFPKDAEFNMRKDFKKDIEVADNVYNPHYVVISSKLKALVEPLTKNKIELLPVKINNHKGRVASSEHFVLNPLDTCDCIDLDASGAKWNKIDKTSLASCKSLVIDPAKVPPDFTLFRPVHWLRLVLVREDVVEKISAEKLTGLAFRAAGDFRG